MLRHVAEPPMHVRFDLSSGEWAENPSLASQEGDMRVDYVRVWTR